MLQFKSFLKEYRKAPLGQKFSKVAILNLLADEENVELLRTHISFDNKDFVFVEYSFDSKNKMFAIINRINCQDVAGYMVLKVIGIGWQIQDVAIYPEYRNRGLGIDLYVKVIQMGINLISGYSLSKNAEKVWLEKLPRYVNVGTYNKRSNLTSDLSDKPVLDNRSDVDQEWFFIASSKNETLTGLDENYLPDDGLFNLLYENWLRNVGIQTQTFRSSKFGEEKEF